ncbi:MAG: hypothetical protein QOG59_912 [Solirubrobacteraceae bacterium]|jgi:FkbM family methyltransferase|nr:hypothetical protein [Solirubrobacteraceae bacterium]
MLGGRSPALVARSVVEPEQYRALGRMVRLYPHFGDVARRYFIGSGSYPYRCRVRTPTGEVCPTTYTHHDIFTVHEIFGREDYQVGPDLRTVVDIGSNIGISALYFLSRNSAARAYLFEPVPRNVERLHQNLQGYEGRYVLAAVAVGPQESMVEFTIEETGRYGGIGVPGDQRIQVRCQAVANIIDEVLEREDQIDMLKIDTEGAERATIEALRPEQLSRITTICFETRTPFNPDPKRFAMTFACETCRLEQR